MERVLALLFCTCMAVGLGVAVMIYGWGLHPQNWWWIVGGGMFGVTILRVVIDSIENHSKAKR